MRVLLGLFIAILGAVSQSSTPGEADEILTQLSKIRLDKKQIYSIRDMTIRRDVLSISFNRGFIAFLEPVRDNVTGAVFIGSGEIVAIPPDPIERQQVYKFTGTPLLNETFQTAIFRFTDSTYSEIQSELSQHAQEDLSAEDIAQFEPLDEAIAGRGKLLDRRILADLLEPAAKKPFFIGELKSDRVGWFDVLFDLRAAEEVSIFQLHDAGAAAVADVWARFNQRSKARNREAAAHDSESTTDILSFNGQNGPAFAYLGRNVAPASYHDAWLFESLTRYLPALQSNDSDGATLRKLLEESSEQLKPIESAGPIWLGRRLASTRSLAGYRVAYTKGVWVLHMIRVMLGDAKFVAMLSEFVETHGGATASTYDFKRLVEKYVGQKLDWFFDEWVFGTGIPAYAVDYKIEPSGDTFTLTGTVKQSGVPEGFSMPVPIYADDQLLGDVQVSDTDADFRYQVSKKPGRILIDPRRTILTTASQ